MKRISLLLCLFSTQLMAQDLANTALQKFNNQQWEEASKDYKKLLKKDDSDSSHWYNLGYSYAQLQKHDLAIEHFQEAFQRNYNASFVYFNIAKIHASRNDENSMITSINEGASKGLAAFSAFKRDPAFSNFQENDGFKEALKKVELNAYPCLSSEDYRHFDFWIGEWDVYANGTKVGVNSITMAKGGCAIHENYTTPRNYAGQSINFYDPIDKKWHQHWVGSAGDTYNYVEIDRKEGMLQFQSQFMGPQGNISLSRLTFTLNEDGTVRQLFEASTDNGETWSSAFDGLYKKAN